MSSLFRSQFGLSLRVRSFSAKARVSVVVVKDFPQLGYAGEVRHVRAGYARNYLIPQGIALYGTRVNVQRHAIKGDDERLERIRNQRQIEHARKRISQIQLDFKRRVNENKNLYGSVTANEITNLLFEKYNIDISPDKVQMEPVRKPGVHKVSIEIENGETAPLTVNVMPVE